MMVVVGDTCASVRSCEECPQESVCQWLQARKRGGWVCRRAKRHQCASSKHIHTHHKHHKSLVPHSECARGSWLPSETPLVVRTAVVPTWTHTHTKTHMWRRHTHIHIHTHTLIYKHKHTRKDAHKSAYPVHGRRDTARRAPATTAAAAAATSRYRKTTSWVRGPR